MQFLITFLEGIITFISPCILPMLPLYILYFAGEGAQGRLRKSLINAAGFVLGFTIVFILLGVFAGTIGGFLIRYQRAVNIVAGAIIIVFGLHYAGLLKLGFLSRTMKPDVKVNPRNFAASVLFGLVFAIGWSPCTGAFLGSAMLMAASQQSWLMGVMLLLCYSMGLGIPFLLCAVLIDRLKSAFDFIKRNYQVINRVCGAFLILIGILMMTGLFSRLAAILI